MATVCILYHTFFLHGCWVCWVHISFLELFLVLWVQQWKKTMSAVVDNIWFLYNENILKGVLFSYSWALCDANFLLTVKESLNDYYWTFLMKTTKLHLLPLFSEHLTWFFNHLLCVVSRYHLYSNLIYSHDNSLA